MLSKNIGLIGSLVGLVLMTSAARGVTIDTTHIIGNNSDDTGDKTIVTLDLLQLVSDPSPAFIAAMSLSKAAANWPGLTFNWAGSLSGTFSVDVYNAAHVTARIGGAQFLLHYNSGAGDPAAAGLFWIQVIDTSNPNGGEIIPYPDVYTGANAGSSLPFFFTPSETVLDPNPWTSPNQPNIRSSTYTVGTSNTDFTLYGYDMAFWDFPKRRAAAYWNGELFLASYNQASASITIFDGVDWGFDITKVPPTTPLPSSLVLFLGPALLAFYFAHPVRMRRAKSAMMT